jgi:hypothetical protein
LNDVQAANGQLVDLQGLKPRLPDHKPADGKTTDCQHADCERTEGDGADRKRDNGGGRQGFGSNRHVSRHEQARHEQPPRIVAVFPQINSSRLFRRSENASDRRHATITFDGEIMTRASSSVST